MIGTERRDGRDNRVAQGGGEAVAVAGRAALRIGLPASGQDKSLGEDCPPRGLQLKAVARRLDVGQRFLLGQAGAALLQAPQQNVEHVGCPIAAGKDFAARLDLGGHRLGGKEVAKVMRSQGRQGGVEEAAGRAEGLDDSPGVRVVSQIAAAPAGQENLRARAAVFFQHERFPALPGRPASGHQPRRPRAHNDNVQGFHEDRTREKRRLDCFRRGQPRLAIAHALRPRTRRVSPSISPAVSRSVYEKTARA